jgi:hypothetical protein
VTGAAQSRALPAFALTAPDGASVSSETLAQAEPWLMLIAQQPCRGCDGTFAVLDAVVKQAQSPRIVVVLVNGTAMQARGMSSRYPRLAAARWLLDPARAALPAVGAGGSPVIVGLRGTSIEWTRGIGSATPVQLESLITSWLQ